MKNSKKWTWILVVSVLSLVFILGIIRHRHLHPQVTAVAEQLPVSTVAVRLADVPFYIDALGTVTPSRTVTITTQINGILDAVNFKEGQQIRKGQVIAMVDARALQAQLAQANGILVHDQAALSNARHDLLRYQSLINAGSISRQTLDSQAATVREEDGTVHADMGSVKNIQVQLSYCRITSPVDGVVGLRLVDPGNYVTTNASGIAVITQMQPATVVFAVPENAIEKIHQAMMEAQTPVLAYDSDKMTQLATGSLMAIDNSVDTATGTVKVKARFDKAGDALFPNQFVNVRVRLGVLNHIPVVPTVAIQHGSNGDFVFVVRPGGKVLLQNVKVGPVSGYNTALTSSAVHVGDQVVTDGADKLDDGSVVQVVTKEQQAGRP